MPVTDIEMVSREDWHALLIERDLLLAQQGELVEALIPLVNLSKHPMFHEQTELPAWEEKVSKACALLTKLGKS